MLTCLFNPRLGFKIALAAAMAVSSKFQLDLDLLYRGVDGEDYGKMLSTFQNTQSTMNLKLL